MVRLHGYMMAGDPFPRARKILTQFSLLLYLQRKAVRPQEGGAGEIHYIRDSDDEDHDSDEDPDDNLDI